MTNDREEKLRKILKNYFDINTSIKQFHKYQNRIIPERIELAIASILELDNPYKEALKKIMRHYEIIAEGLTPISVVYNIAKQALDQTEEIKERDDMKPNYGERKI